MEPRFLRYRDANAHENEVQAQNEISRFPNVNISIALKACVSAFLDPMRDKRRAEHPV